MIENFGEKYYKVVILIDLDVHEELGVHSTVNFCQHLPGIWCHFLLVCFKVEKMLKYINIYRLVTMTSLA